MKKLNAYIIGGDMSVHALLSLDKRLNPINGGRVDFADMDILVYTGGADVHPRFYGEEIAGADWLNEPRDEYEFDIYNRTKEKYHFGICRGAQLLWIANGGKLWQDITGHSLRGTHHIKTLDGQDIDGVTSLHHQCARVTKDMQANVLAWEEYHDPVLAESQDVSAVPLRKVPETVWFPKTRCFGVQGHPEYPHASRAFKNYTLNHLLDDPFTGYYATSTETM
jgi:putative glutamine amidotransferase